jgi:hypothetical protein
MADLYAAPVNEGTTPRYTTILKDDQSVAITGMPFTGIRATYYSAPSGTVINLRDGQNALNANDFTVDEDGVFTWKMTEDDVLIIEDPKPVFVVHRLVLVIEWNDAEDTPRQVTHVVHVPIVRVDYAPFEA